MACATVVRHFRHKAVARDWFGNSADDSNLAPLTGSRLEFVQETPRSLTHALVSFRGLRKIAKAYHVHVIPVQSQLDFPCTGEAVGGHFNPLKVSD